MWITTAMPETPTMGRPTRYSSTTHYGLCRGRAMADGAPLSNNEVDRSRTRAGALVVVASNFVIAASTTFAVFRFGDKDFAQMAAILTAAFTAVGTMTTAYLGIRAASNTAQSAVAGVGEQVAKAIQQQQPTPQQPSVTNIDPKTGNAAGGEPVTITGSGFSPAAVVKFGSNTALSRFEDDTRITAMGRHGSGDVDVTVDTHDGTSTLSDAVRC